MKKSILFAMILLISVGFSFGQKGKKNNATPEIKAKRQTEKLTKELLLSADQQTKVYDAILVRINKVAEVKAKYKGAAQDKEKRRLELKEIKDNFVQTMKSILSPEQFEKWEKARAARIEKAKAKKGPKGNVVEPVNEEDIE